MASEFAVEALAERLLAAHVAFIKAQLLESGAFGRAVEREVDATLAISDELTMLDVVTPQMIKDTAYKYAVQLPLAGLIPEIVGEVAARIHGHRIQDEMQVDDVIDPRRFDALIDGIAQMEATDRIMRSIVTSPAAVDVCVGMIVSAIENGIHEIEEAPEQGLRARVASQVSSAVNPLLPLMESGVARVARPGARFVLASLGEDGAAQILDAARATWRKHSDDSVGSFRDLITGDDVEDMIVVGVEFWRTFRDTDYFREVLYAAIDHVFDKLGDLPMTVVLENLGIGRDDLIEEAHRFGPPVMGELDQRGVLEEAIRRNLAPFYSSDFFRDAVTPGADDAG